MFWVVAKVFSVDAGVFWVVPKALFCVAVVVSVLCSGWLLGSFGCC